MLRLFFVKQYVTRLQKIHVQQVYRCHGQLKSKAVTMASPIEGATPSTPAIFISKENNTKSRPSNSKSSKSRRSLFTDLESQPRSAIVVDNNEEEEENNSKGWRVYLIISADMRKTYVGVTTNFKRRLRQHNGELSGGAKASRAGRPWQCVCLVHGFKDRSEGPMVSVRDTLGIWGKKVGEATKMTGEIAGNVWQHLKTGPSLADTAMERIAQGTKVLTEGGYEKIFRQNFDSLPEEKLLKTYACYLSTSAGPVIGTLYLTDRKIAFCSDNPLSYKVNQDKTEWSFYKVVLPFNQLKAVNPSANKTKPLEKYIQIVSTDNHEFWFMGFVNYDKAVKNLQGILTKEGTEPLRTQSSGGQFETI